MILILTNKLTPQVHQNRRHLEVLVLEIAGGGVRLVKIFQEIYLLYQLFAQ